MKYRVRALRRARRDVDAILDWIARQRKSPQGAVRWRKAYETAAAALAHSPHRHSRPPERNTTDLDLRQFLFKTSHGRFYRGLFIIDGDEVLILRIRGPGQPLLAPDEMPPSE